MVFYTKPHEVPKEISKRNPPKKTTEEISEKNDFFFFEECLEKNTWKNWETL